MTILDSKYAASFPAALEQMGVSLLVSTYQANQLVTVRVEKDGSLNTNFLPSERPMGIAADGRKITVASGPQVVEYWNIPDQTIEDRKFDAVYLPRSTHVVGGIDTHELAYGQDDELWLVNTRMSCLCSLDRKHSVVPRWRPPFISGYDTTDRCHLNGLAMRDEQPAFLSALGKSDQGAGWRSNRATGGILMEYPSGDIICEGLSMPHSPRWHNDNLWVLESGEGALCLIDTLTGSKQTVTRLQGFTRGMAFFGRYVFIGLSKVRDSNIFGGLAITRRGEDRDSGIVLVDTESGELVSSLIFTGKVDEVFDIAILPARYPEVVSMNDDLVQTFFSLPESELALVVETTEIEKLMIEATRLISRGQHEQALSVYQQILEKQPEHQFARQGMANTLYQIGKASEARLQYQNLIERIPDQINFRKAQADTYCDLGEFEQARINYKKAIELDSQNPGAHLGLAALDLATGDVKAGYEGFAWFHRLPGLAKFYSDAPLWQDTCLKQKQLLVHALGDDGKTIFFSRYLQQLKRCDIKAKVVASQEMANLMTAKLSYVDFVSPEELKRRDEEKSCDAVCSVYDLPRILYFHSEDVDHNNYHWRRNPVHTEQSALKIGVVTFDPNNAFQRYAAESFVDLLSIDAAEFIYLHPRVPEASVEMLEKHQVNTTAVPSLKDYVAYANLIEGLDLVIAPDISCIHLAASLGVETWLLRPLHFTWTWSQQAVQTFYPNIKVFSTHPEEVDVSFTKMHELLIDRLN